MVPTESRVVVMSMYIIIHVYWYYQTSRMMMSVCQQLDVGCTPCTISAFLAGKGHAAPLQNCSSFFGNAPLYHLMSLRYLYI